MIEKLPSSFGYCGDCPVLACPDWCAEFREQSKRADEAFRFLSAETTRIRFDFWTVYQGGKK